MRGQDRWRATARADWRTCNTRAFRARPRGCRCRRAALGRTVPDPGSSRWPGSLRRKEVTAWRSPQLDDRAVGARSRRRPGPLGARRRRGSGWPEARWRRRRVGRSALGAAAHARPGAEQRVDDGELGAGQDVCRRQRLHGVAPARGHGGGVTPLRLGERAGSSPTSHTIGPPSPPRSSQPGRDEGRRRQVVCPESAEHRHDLSSRAWLARRVAAATAAPACSPSAPRPRARRRRWPARRPGPSQVAVSSFFVARQDALPNEDDAASARMMPRIRPAAPMLDVTGAQPDVRHDPAGKEVNLLCKLTHLLGCRQCAMAG